jgi:uncharacterized protein YndB with AHSA1/START domain
MRLVPLAAAILAFLPAVARAEVKSASPNSFVIEHRLTLPLAQRAAWETMQGIADWWDPAHTYGSARKGSAIWLRLEMGGCFCERIGYGDGTVEHLRVSYVEPPRRVVLTGALGPLLYEAVNGVMDIQLRPAGRGTELTLTYKATGFAASNADQLAPLVDRVLGEQLGRLTALAATKPVPG